LEYRSKGWNYLPTHKKCGRLVSREQVMELLRPTGNSTEERLMHQGRYAEVFLLNWSTVEIAIDNCVSYQFGHESTDDEVEILYDISFGRKLGFLKDRGILTNEEFKSIQDLQRRRNKIVHREGWVSETGEYRTLAEDSRRAATVAALALDRLLQKNPKLPRDPTDGGI